MRAVVVLLEDYIQPLEVEETLPFVDDGKDLIGVPFLNHWATDLDVVLTNSTILELLVLFLSVLVKDELGFEPYGDHRPNRELGSRRSPFFLYAITTVPFVRVADHPFRMTGVLVEMTLVRKMDKLPLPLRPLMCFAEIHRFLALILCDPGLLTSSTFVKSGLVEVSLDGTPRNRQFGVAEFIHTLVFHEVLRHLIPGPGPILVTAM